MYIFSLEQPDKKGMKKEARDFFSAYENKKQKTQSEEQETDAEQNSQEEPPEEETD